MRADDLLLSEGKPNPFSRSTRIDFSVPRAGHVTLRIYDVAGHHVRTLVDDELTAGAYRRQWSAGGLPAGAYFYRLDVGDITGTRRLLLVR